MAGERKSSRELAKSWPYKRFAEYEKDLRCAAARWFQDKGAKVHEKMGYCLKNHTDWAKNIICPEVTDYIEAQLEKASKSKPFPFHKYIHHGLSSQAMIFNLLGALVAKKDYGPLRDALIQEGIGWPTGEIGIEFEYSDRNVFNEDVGQPTSFDVVVSGEKNCSPIFIEAKLAEKEFGGCSVFAKGDCDGRNPLKTELSNCYLDFIGRAYWELMVEHGFGGQGLASGQICPFSSYYQFFRELLFALEKGGFYILLHDERNPAFIRPGGEGEKSGLWPFLMESVPARHRARVGRLTIQQVVRAIEESGRHGDWIHEFKDKYGLV